jgi:hypothetical protein
MEEVTTQHTIAIFRHLYEFVRGALPADLQAEMEHALDHVERDTELTREDIEHTMIVFGKKVWPYRKALQEMVEHTEGTMGDQLFRSSLSRSMQKRFQEFLDHGGSLRDIHSGGAVHFFSSEERVELNHALVDMHEHLRAFTVQRIRGIGARDFDTRVSDFARILAELEQELDHIRTMADNTQEHPLVAREMREHVRGFEEGLCFLGVEYTPEEVYNAQEHFHGRKREIRARGVDLLVLQ